MAITALAGPIANLIMGFVFITGSVFCMNLIKEPSLLFYAIFNFLTFAGVLNVNLAVFNFDAKIEHFPHYIIGGMMKLGDYDICN